MASTATLLVASSPAPSMATTGRHTSYSPLLPSSPSLPSPSQFLSMEPSQKRNPIPEGAVAGFRSVSLNKARPVERIPFSDGLSTTTRKSETEKANKPVFIKPRKILDIPPEDEPDDPEEGTEIPPLQASETPQNPAPKKSRKKRSKDEEPGQTRIRKAKITKPGVTDDTAKRKTNLAVTKRAGAAAGSKFKKVAKKKDSKTPEELLNLQLREATKRRQNWTPTKDTAQDLSCAAAIPPPYFGGVLGDFGFAHNKDDALVDSATTRGSHNEAFVKRRKLELVNGISCQAAHVQKVVRSKSPKKKPQTVTEKATAPYMPEVAPTPSLLEYFSPPGGSETNVDKQSKRKRKLPVKSPSKSRIEPVVLSPRTAMKSAKDQEIIFGTSSQLAYEESPTLVMDLQQALKESELVEEHAMPLPSHEHCSGSLSGPSITSGSLGLTPSRSLWSIAARDFDGSLLEAEVVNLTESPNPEALSTKSKLPPLRKGREDTAREWNIIGDCSSPETSVAPKSRPESVPAVTENDKVVPRSVAESTLKERPKSRSPIRNTAASKAKKDEMPNYKGFTDARLSEEVKSNGFKAIKKREAMIALLEKCWESKRNLALQELPPNLGIHPPARPQSENPTSPAKKATRPRKTVASPPKEASSTNPTTTTLPPPKKPRGRPRKTPTTSTANPKPAPQPPTAALQPQPQSKPPSPPLPQPPTLSKTPSSPLLPLHLHPQITTAILSAPPTHDPKNLSWRERILMYEPLVIEDLTGWLNTEGLASVGEDQEVGVGVVKAWCEGQGVCCLWKESGRGGKGR